MQLTVLFTLYKSKSIIFTPVIILENKSFLQINHQPDATIFQFIILTFVYSSTCFGRFPAQLVSGVFPPIIRSSMTAVAASGYTFVSW
jgi:hypothetical protein